MTPEQRAEKIVLPLHLEVDKSIAQDVARRIAAEIRAAVEEANFQKDQEIVFIKQEFAEMGARQAFEQAAKLVEKNMLASMAQDGPAEVWMANLIRALAKQAEAFDAH